MKIRRVLALSPAMILAMTALLLSFSRGPLPQLTGGFGEGTCVSCHNSHNLNDGRVCGGMFEIDGVPRFYSPGKTYPLTVIIGQPGQARWGFELASRFAQNGQQAGKLVSKDGMTQILEADGVQYIEHSMAGTREGVKDGPVEFHFDWIAPDPPVDRVLFNAAGNAADSNGNVTGDFIYTASAWSEPGGGAPQMTSVSTPKVEPKWGDRVNDSSKVLDLPAPAHLRKGAFEMNIQHRFFEGLADSRPGDAFGVDSGANINLGVNYAITNRFSLGVSRARIDEIIAWTGTYEIQTSKESFWKMSVLGGVEGQRNFEQQFSPFLQVAASIDYKGLRLYTVPTLVIHSRNRELVDLFAPEIVNPDSNNTFSMGIGTDIALNKRFSLVGEVIPRLAGYGGIDNHRPTISAGFEIRTWGHVFSIQVSSSRDFTPAQYAVNPKYNNVSLGFNIYRRIR